MPCRGSEGNVLFVVSKGYGKNTLWLFVSAKNILARSAWLTGENRVSAVCVVLGDLLAWATDSALAKTDLGLTTFGY